MSQEPKPLSSCCSSEIKLWIDGRYTCSKCNQVIPNPSEAHACQHDEGISWKEIHHHNNSWTIWPKAGWLICPICKPQKASSPKYFLSDFCPSCNANPCDCQPKKAQEPFFAGPFTKKELEAEGKPAKKLTKEQLYKLAKFIEKELL